MFANKKATVKLEGYNFLSGLTLITKLATSPEFSDLTFGINKEASRISIKGPRASVDNFMDVARMFAS